MKLYLDPSVCAALAQAGRAAYLEHFAWERAREDYIGIYTGEIKDRLGLAFPDL